ncbi:hypothetical protein ACFPTO_13235 [Paraburkholderia denitrificans]|uniref:DUF3108 domain-containing protein n=1 Tax=Paraburkholderia denitrificans TaxID=694025 RepID=A0ABW0J9L0_9BURK
MVKFVLPGLQSTVATMLGLLAANCVAEPAYENYRAVYRVYAPGSSREIGSYQVRLNWVPEKQLYRLAGEINFDYRAFLSRIKYDYADVVWFDSRDDVAFEAQEVNNGRKRLINGQRDPLNGGLLVKIEDGSSADRTSRFAAADYDFTTFALRFPKACGPASVGEKLDKRMLDPIGERIDRVSSEYVSYGSARLPNLASSTSPLCLVQTHSTRDALNRRSWISPDGYLVYEESPAYTLALDSSRSVLPPQRRKGTP